MMVVVGWNVMCVKGNLRALVDRVMDLRARCQRRAALGMTVMSPRTRLRRRRTVRGRHCIFF